ncbi:MAG: hypothetical protein JWM11_2598 [Planctomycetaceae bacterium]|nr:hypothetical protein [Planctomycetaceae bacterium]
MEPTMRKIPVIPITRTSESLLSRKSHGLLCLWRKMPLVQGPAPQCSDLAG